MRNMAVNGKKTGFPPARRKWGRTRLRSFPVTDLVGLLRSSNVCTRDADRKKRPPRPTHTHHQKKKKKQKQNPNRRSFHLTHGFVFDSLV